MPRVLLMYHNPLFAYSIRVALGTCSEITLAGEIRETFVEADIARLAPDVVIVEDDGNVAADDTLRALCQRQAPWRMIALGLDETTMRIWSSSWQSVACTQNLIDAVMAP